MDLHCLYFYVIFDLIKDKIKKIFHINPLVSSILDKIRIFLFYLIVWFCGLILASKIDINNAFFVRTVSIYPINAMNFLKENGYKGNVLAPFGISGFIAYKYYPDFKIFMDGRQEQVYPDDYIGASVDFYLAQRDDVLKKWPPDFILLENEWTLNRFKKGMFEKYGYKNIYSDSIFSLYAKKEIAKAKHKAPSRFDVKYIDTLFKTKILE